MKLELSEISCDVVIAHHNYSDFIEAALGSVLKQTHEKFQCIIVDDASTEDHYERLSQVVKKLSDSRIRICRLEENVGQILALYEGIKRTSSEFVAFLDPDDEYDPDFLSGLLQAHFNPITIAAVATCDMGLFRVGSGPIANRYIRALNNDDAEVRQNWTLHQATYGYSAYFPPWRAGWLWATTSALMIRRDALEMIEPNGFVPETKAFGDTYVVQGAHMLGGTLLVDKVLSWRGIHANNTVESSRLVSQHQERQKGDFDPICRSLKAAALRSLLRNGGSKVLTPANFGEIIASHFSAEDILSFAAEDPHFRELLIKYAANALR